MAVISGAALAKAAKIAVQVLSNEKARKSVGWVIAAILSPFILVIIAFAVLLSGGSSSNKSAVELCFNTDSLSSVSAEYKQGIQDMRSAFSSLDLEINKIEIENGSLDDLRIKAIFYALFYAHEDMSSLSKSKFVQCFYYIEERTRTITTTNDLGEEAQQTQTYTVNLLYSDLLVVYSNISSAFGVEITDQIMTNATEIYYRQKYGSIEELPSDVPFVGIDGFVEPVANWKVSVSSEYGTRIHPITFVSQLHGGIDIAKPAGTQIFSVLDGVVTSAIYSDSGYGYHLIIDHGNGFTTLYAHCSSLLVTVGQEVKAGEKIALVGTTGSSTGNHLHFETIVNGEKVNPRAYLP